MVNSDMHSHAGAWEREALSTHIPAIRFKEFSGVWDEKILEQVVDLRSGRDYKHLSTGDIPVYGTGGYMLSVNQALSYDEDAIGIGRKGTIDKPYILKAPFWTVDTLFYAVPNIKNNLEFVFNIFQKINWRQRDESTGVPSLSKVAINSILVFTTDETEQAKIGNYFQQLDTLIAQHQQKHDKLLNLKKSLLEKMFPKQGCDVPEIRFKGFSGAWNVCELGKNSIIKGRLGWKSLKQNEYLDDGPSMIAGRHITDGMIDWNSVDHIPEWRYFESPEIMLKNNDVIFSKDGSLGNPAIIKNLKWSATINSTMMLVRPAKKLVSDFFFQILKTKKFDDLIKLKVSGSSIPHLFQADMNEFTFDFPETEEQTKISNLLKQLDTLINQHQSQLKKLGNIKQACLAKMFV